MLYTVSDIFAKRFSTMEKSAGIQIEFKDLDTSKRTAVIKHAVYTSVDRTKDISTKGMFTKSWNENKPDFLFNHKEGQIVGPTVKMYDDNEGAYTEVKFGKYTLGNDVLEMADEGVIKGASYGYVTDKREFVEIKGQKVRRLKEVKHLETSLLTVLPAHPDAGIVVLNKSYENIELKQLTPDETDFLNALVASDLNAMGALVSLAGSLDASSDLYSWVMWQISRRADGTGSIMSQLQYNAASMKSMKSQVEDIEKYCRKAKASDETIIQLQDSLQEYKKVISDYDTAITRAANEPVVSDEEVKSQLSNFLTLLNLERWKKQSLSN
jgi:HK97 family phage prohead protease